MATARITLKYDTSPGDASGEWRELDVTLDVSQFSVTIDRSGTFFMNLTGKVPK